MGSPQVAELVRKFGAMVRVHGPDPKGMKMRRHAFHQYSSGKTMISASGLLLPGTLFDLESVERLFDCNGDGVVGLVVTIASVVEPFLSLEHRQGISQGRPELIPGGQIDVMLEGNLVSEGENRGIMDIGAPRWLKASLLKLVDVPVSALAIQSLVEASSGLVDLGWEVGWSLASHDDITQPFPNATGKQAENSNKSKSLFESRGRVETAPNLVGQSTSRLAILGLSLPLKDMPTVSVSTLNRRGDFILVVGSPFGALSPLHFFNSLSKGSIANCYSSGSSNMSLLMADIRCLPGMEGGPVFCEHANLVGILIRPLRQRTSGAEIQLVIPWDAIATACSDLLLKEPQIAEKGAHINEENLNAVGMTHNIKSDRDRRLQSNYDLISPNRHFSLAIESSMASICLITIDDGVWASGVMLNDQGLILTNAHLLEPWRFRKTTTNGEIVTKELPKNSGLDDHQKSLQSRGDSSMVDDNLGYKLSFPQKRYRKIRVRMDHVDPWIWRDAKIVYVCKGPLDVALLQLEYVPEKLCPVNVDFRSPSPGLPAYVVGHGLFGPKCGFSPSVCSGIVAKVVKGKAPPYSQSSQQADLQVPIMLETTAAVHPGGSGGAVINSDGRMIGLVTSNARHGGGTVIPHLNFSIPSAALVPIFEFAKDMQNKSLLESLDQPNEQLSSIWALVPPLSPKPSPTLPKLSQSVTEDSGKQEKGSKFAQFLAEREKKLLRSTQLGKTGNVPKEIIPSKL